MTPNRIAMMALAASMALAGCGQDAAQTATREPIDPATGLVACPTHDGVLPSRGGEGVQQSPASLPVGFQDGSQRCIAANNANAALFQHGPQTANNQ
jgi:hypothetical protein